MENVKERFSYLTDRVVDQIQYFDHSASYNQRRYKLLKRIAITSSVLTTILIAVAFIVPDTYRLIPGIAALVLSAMVLATYQWEEFENYGAKWEKFRLVAEQIKSEQFLFLNHAGVYTNLAEEEAKVHLVETIEGVIRGTDIGYFSLLVEPGKRIEKRMG